MFSLACAARTSSQLVAGVALAARHLCREVIVGEDSLKGFRHDRVGSLAGGAAAILATLSLITRKKSRSRSAGRPRRIG